MMSIFTPSESIWTSTKMTTTHLNGTKAAYECQEQPNLTLSKHIMIYTSPFIFTIGLIGNILTIIVMTRPKFSKSISSWFFVALAGADSLVLIMFCVRTWMIEILPISYFYMLQSANWRCISNHIADNFPLQSSSWTLVLITWERVLAVNFPIHSKNWITKGRGMFLLIGVNILLLTVNAAFAPYISFHHVKMGACLKSDIWVSKWKLLNIFIYALIPVLFLIIGNVFITVRIAISKKEVKNNMKVNQDKNKVSSITLMLMTTCLVFLFTTVPYSVFSLNYFSSIVPCTDDIHKIFNIRITDSVLRMLKYSNHSINFWLYCISGRKFRREFMRMFGIKVQKFQ